MRLRIPRASVVAVPLALLVIAVTFAGPAGAAKTLRGSVGPGFTISLKSGGKKVKSVTSGSYRFTIRDRADIHNFHLRGPGVNRWITTVDFEGTKSVTLRLRKGTYRYQCDPHSADMKGSFKVR